MNVHLGEVQARGRRLYLIPDAPEIVACDSCKLEADHIEGHVGHREGSPQVLCQHKIIASMQCAIMHVAPFRTSEALVRYARGREDGGWDKTTRFENALFAISVSTTMLERSMKDDGQRDEVIRYLSDPRLKQTLRENFVWLAYSLKKGPEPTMRHFPFFLVSQFWSMVEYAAILAGGGHWPPHLVET
jgi:hypothetical protein